MNIIGLNSGLTKAGKKLKDGGTCLIRDSKIEIVVHEERVSRNKQDGGYKLSLLKVLEHSNLSVQEIQAIAYSTCCETLDNSSGVCTFNENHVDYIPVNHHLSHAYSVFSISPFEEAVIVVLDAGGNVLDGDGNEWWKCRREQHSYFMGTPKGIVALGTDFSSPFESGFAEVYRAFSHYLGWQSSQYAGKVMALSAYGNVSRFAENHIFYLEGDNLRSAVINDPSAPLAMVESILLKFGITDIPSRKKDAKFLDCHKDLACWLQSEMEEAFFKKIEILIRQTGVKNVCLAGGVGYNCKMNGKALQHPDISGFFVGPASGDQGQCVGNALFALHTLTGYFNKITKFTPYLGILYDQSSLENKLIDAGLKVLEVQDVLFEVANLISSGNIIAWYNGRSEFGPRALGSRSILADPRRATMKVQLNRLKNRELFMPFAPSVLDDYVEEYFHGVKECKYMTHAVPVKRDLRNKVPAIVHSDGTSRIHRIVKDENPLYHCLVEKFLEITQIPMVLNTSFNRTGEPIVESHSDAIESFLGLGLKYMFIEGFLVENTLVQNVSIQTRPIKPLTFSPDEYSRDKIAHHLHDVMPINFSVRQKFNLNKEFVDWLHYGRKTTTIRFKQNEIEIPGCRDMPMYSTPKFEMDLNSTEYVGTAEILRYEIKQYSELDYTDAINDGFDSIDELKETLTSIYGLIPSNAYVTVYTIYLNPEAC